MKITTPRSMRALTPTVYTTVSFTQEHERTELVRTEHGEYELLVGTKELQPMTARKFRTLMRRVVRTAQGAKRERLALRLEALLAVAPKGMERGEVLRTFTENAFMAAYEFTTFKEAPKEGRNEVKEFVLVGELDAKDKAALRVGEIVAEETNKCRDLANIPGGDMTPSLLAAAAKAAAKGTEAKVTVLSKLQMAKLGMGAVLGVARGSAEEPKFIIVEYRGGKAKDAPIVLVGKGVTFDSGGLNLQPRGGLEMHLDMSGGAAVLHAVIAAARLKLSVNVAALIPAVENMPSGESYRPGDILRSMSGKTIEVLNTDAEGRIILADALTYAQKYKPALVVDVATLTGGALVALGTKASIVMTQDDGCRATFVQLGEKSGDYCWPLPMWDEYKDTIQSKFADVANISTDQPRNAQTINGGMFLSEFAQGYPEGTPWVHIDMAPRMTADKSDQLAEGAAGAPVRLLVRLLEQGV